ncbi:MAG: efflux RND transporter periplasmic adaptor subunit [Pseudomonadota bacterium]
MKKISAKPLAIVVLVLLLAAAAVYFFSARKSDAAKPAAEPKPALTVSVAQPQAASLPLVLAANGNVTAWQEAVIGSESNGLRLTQVLVNVGDAVKAGQVLAVFSTESVQADVAQARASLVEAEASAADAAANAERARTLQSSGALSTQQINQYLTAAQTAQARVEAARAVLGAQQLRGRQTQVLAPDSGVISSRTATVGSVVSAGTELFRMIRQGRLEWRAEVTSAELGRIAPGMTAVVHPASGGDIRGRVRMIAPTVDPQTRSALVYVDLPAVAGRGALAGMFARGEFILGASNVLTVPQRALVVRDGFNFVYQLGSDSRVRQVKVQSGRLAGDRVEVTGLAADARIVTDGAGFLNDGDLVRVGEASVAAAQGPAAAASAASVAAATASQAK